MKNIYFLFTLFVFLNVSAQNPATVDLDLSFNIKDNIFLDDGFIKTHVLPNGKILVLMLKTYPYSYTLSYNKGLKKPTGQLFRLNADLTIDNDFKFCETDNNKSISDFDVATDGKIIVVGNFNVFNGVAVNKIARLFSDGEVDNSFNLINNGFSGFIIYTLDSIKILPDNKILVSGGGLSIKRPGGVFSTGGVARLYANGNVDETFKASVQGKLINAINVLSNGKILCLRSSYNASPFTQSLNISRLNPNGTNDGTFNVSSSVFGNYNYYSNNSGYISMSYEPRMKIQSDGKIIIYGDFTANNKLLRLDGSGTIDTSFIPYDLVQDFILNSDSTFYILNLNGSGQSVISKINSNGAIIWDKASPQDTKFRSIFPLSNNEILGKITWETVISGSITINTRDIKLSDLGEQILNKENSTYFPGKNILCTSSNEILILGPIKYNGALNYHNGIKRLSSNGNLDYNDNLFNPFIQDLLGVTTDKNFFYDSMIQPDGKIILFLKKYTNASTDTYKLIRLNPDFSIDLSFSFYDNLLINSIKSIALQADGKILICYNNYYAGVIERLNIDGSLDSTFNPPTFNGYVNFLKSLGNGKILVGGEFTDVSSYVFKGLACINIDGSVDASFPLPTNFSGYINKIVFQNDGKILLMGNNIDTIGIPNNQKLIRLNADFTIDTTFLYLDVFPDQQGGFIDIKTQIDGKIVLVCIAGYNSAYKLIRINNNGSLDSGFDIGTGFNGKINSVYPQNDGNILVTGDFTKYNGTWCNGTVRLIGSNSYQIKGTNRIDFDLDGCNASDLIQPNLKFNINNDQFITNNSGNYFLSFSQPGTYSIVPILENSNYFSISPSNLVVNFPADNSPYVQDFCITPSGNHPDLEVVLLPMNVVRPGFDAKYKLVYKNKGNQLQSGTVSLTFNDAVLDLVSSNPLVSNQALNSLNYDFSNLLPFESRVVIITLNVNTPTETPAINSGDILNYSAVISSQSDDIPNDNTFALNQTVVNSLDPNDKTCLQGTTVGTDKVGEYVHYIIHFENSGTYPAQNITVTDFIDTNKFDIDSLTPFNGSHSFITRISGGNKVEFVFENINLNYTAGVNTGYVAFKIKTKPTLAVGDTFSNEASIYFDYNSSIITNNYSTTIQALSKQDFSFGNYFTLYPNPVNNLLNISKKGDFEVQSIHIYNTVGQLILVIPNARNISTIDVSNLTSGNYFMKINSDKGTSNTKFIKN